MTFENRFLTDLKELENNKHDTAYTSRIFQEVDNKVIKFGNMLTIVEMFSSKLAINKSLTYLDLTCSHLNFNSFKILSNAIKINSSVLTIDLRMNKCLDSNCYSLIGDILRENQTLKELTLSCKDNQIKDDQCFVEIANALKVNTGLETFTFFACRKISGNFGRSLADALEINNNLELLSIYRMDASDSAIQIFNSLNQNNNLLGLCLENCNIRDNSIDAMANALKHNWRLQELILANNRICEDGLTKLIRSLSLNNGIRIINLAKNPCVMKYNLQRLEVAAENLYGNFALESIKPFTCISHITSLNKLGKRAMTEYSFKLLTLIFLINKFYTESPFCVLPAELVFNILEFIPNCNPKILLNIKKYLDFREHPLDIDAGMSLFKKANFSTNKML